MLTLIVSVGCGCGGDKDVREETQAPVEEITVVEPDEPVTTDYDEFTLEDPNKVYRFTYPPSLGTAGDLLERSLKDNTERAIDRGVVKIDYSPDGAWIAYNRFYGILEGGPSIHDVENPGENWGGYSMYLAPPYNIEEEGPLYMSPPPLGAYVYFEYSGEKKPLFSVRASGVLEEAGKPANYYGPSKLVDGTRSTAWAEGIDGLGVGEWVELTANVPISIHGIRVWGGYGENALTMTGNAHPVKMSVVLDGDNEAGYVEFPAPYYDEYKEHFGHDKYSDYFGEWRNDPAVETTARAETIRLTIEEVVPGAKWEDCCISEIEVW